jgi:hypothetical protein
MLELTGTVSSRDMQAQLLDSMDLEREKGITIKLQPVQMRWSLGARDASGVGGGVGQGLEGTPSRTQLGHWNVIRSGRWPRGGQPERSR